MDILCAKCGAIYELDELKIPNESARVKCSSCENVFRVYKNQSSISAPEEGSQLLVRSADDVLSQIPDQATLQRMIIEGKIHSLDMLHVGEGQWLPLGEIDELRPFFQILSQNSLSPPTGVGPVLIAGQLDATSTLEFGLPSSFNASVLPRIQTSSPEATYARSVESDGYPPNEPDLSGSMSDPFSLYDDSSVSYSPVTPDQVHSSSQSLPSQQSISNSNLGALLPASSSRLSAVPQQESPYQLEKAPRRPSSKEDFFLESEQNGDGGSYWESGSREVRRISANDNPTIVQNPESESGMHYLSEMPNGPISISRGSHSSLSYASHDVLAEAGLQPTSIAYLGRWFGLVVIILGLVVGSFFLIAPSIFGDVAAILGLADASPDSINKVNDARKLLFLASDNSLTRAERKLGEVKAEEKGKFAAYLATQASLKLSELDLYELRSYLAKKLILHWEKHPPKPKVAKDPKDPKGAKAPDAKQAFLFSQLKILVSKWRKDRSRWMRMNKKRWLKAKGLVDKARRKDARHPYVLLAELHLLASWPLGVPTSQATSKKIKAEFAAFHTLFAKAIARVRDPKRQAWMYVFAANVAIRSRMYQKGLDLAAKALGQFPSWAYPRMLEAQAWIERGKPDKALLSLKDINKYSSDHPLAHNYRTYLQPPSLPTLLTAYGRATILPKVRPVVPPVRPAPRVVERPKPVPPQVVPANIAPRLAPRPAPRPVVRKRVRKRRYYRVSRRLRSAKYLCKRRRYRQAFRVFRSLRRSRNSRVFKEWGWCHFQKKGYSLAIRYFKKAIAISKYQAEAYYGLGLSYKSLNQNSKACRYLKIYLRRFPRSRDAVEVRAVKNGIKSCR